MSEWKEYKISEIGKVITGKTPSSKNPEEWGNIVAFVTPTDFDSYNKSIEGSIRYLSKKGTNVFYSKLLPINSVIVTCIGSQMGKVALNKVPCVTNQQINSIIPNKDFNSDFIYYVISSMQGYLRNLATGGSTMPIVNKSDFENISISAPDLPAQIAIAEILSSLDDKIELNNKINQELENLAQTIFKQWFIDFEFPNENGEPYKSSGGEMVDSELGEIPKGWEVYRFKEIVSKYIDNRGKTPPIANDGIPLVEVRQMVDTGIYPSLRTDKFLSKEVYDTFLRGHLLKDDILMSTVGTIGRLNIVPDFQIFAIAQNVLGIRFNKDLTSQFFMFCLMRTKDFNDEINSRLIETVQSSIKRSDLEKIPVILPKLILVERFDSLIRDIFDRIKNSALEIEELTNLRDILLSKLISGELHVTSKKTNTNYKLS